MRCLSGVFERLNDARELSSTLRRTGFIIPMRPDKYFRIAAAARREKMAPTYAFAAAARRCPDRPGLVDERGTLTWRELDERCDALATALQRLGDGQPQTVGIMCRNHRGFVEALVAANRTGADVVLLNTSFAGPALAEVADREQIDAIVYDGEFAETVDRALVQRPEATRLIAWADGATEHTTVESLIDSHVG